MKLLIIDDEKNIRTSLSRFLELQGNTAESAETGKDGIDLVRKSSYDCILLDLKLPDVEGIQVLEKIREIDPFVPVILLTAHGSTSKAVEAMKKGAFDFFEKPADEEKLLIAIQHARDLDLFHREKSETLRDLDRKYLLVGDSAPMLRLQEQIRMVAVRNSRVLITGESGTGKELVAYAIHRNSARRERSFVKVNCAAIPQELFESELFGHEKGAFTGALQQRIGKFEQAHSGTLFLDEIGEIPLPLQPKILRALQENEIQRVGGQKEIKVDVRIIAATNRKLEEEITKGHFREDLYYRLNVFPIEVPPLREHSEDLRQLIEHFVDQICKEENIKRRKLSDDALKAFEEYDYPGNIRELRNLIERMLILSRAEMIDAQEAARIVPRKPGPGGSDPTALLYSKLEDTERDMIQRVLEEHRWHISKVAKVLGLERSHLYKKMKKYGITRPE